MHLRLVWIGFLGLFISPGLFKFIFLRLSLLQCRSKSEILDHDVDCITIIFHALCVRYKIMELICYTVMGVFPALVILSMVSSVKVTYILKIVSSPPCKASKTSASSQPEQSGLYELLVGGACYCLGMVFFKSDGIVPFAHAIWHLFVAMGAAIHYYAIWKYLYAQPPNQVQTSR